MTKNIVAALAVLASAAVARSTAHIALSASLCLRAEGRFPNRLDRSMQSPMLRAFRSRAREQALRIYSRVTSSVSPSSRRAP